MTDGLIKTKPRKDLSGMTFGRLTVLRQGPDHIPNSGKGYRKPQWYCKCSCGNTEELLILGYSLLSGHTKSCGCLLADHSVENNEFNISGEYGICKMQDGNEFIFDVDDYDLIKDYTWHIIGNGYIGATLEKPKGETIILHRIIMGLGKFERDDNNVVDHINGNIKDNRKSNLRVVKSFENSANRKLHNNNTSGVSGVTFHKGKNKWQASITSKKHTYYLGDYINFEDAVKARKEAEEKYFGEFSYDNSRGVKKGVD